MTAPDERLRIGELSRRVGLSEHVLRAWERRYGVLRPERTSGGFRLYTTADLARVRRMQAALARGISTAEAARIAGGSPDATVDSGSRGLPSPDADPAALLTSRRALTAALDSFDAPAAHTVLDDLLTTHGVETALRDVVLPYLHELGERWASGEVDVSQEHFASNLLRARLGGLAGTSTVGAGPLAVLACPPGEQHDLPLLMLAVCLARRGWRTAYLGADVPVPDLTAALDRLRPDLVVLASASRSPLEAVTAALRELPRSTRVALGGRGSSAALAEAAGALHLTEDPVTAAGRLDAAVGNTPAGSTGSTDSTARTSTESEGRP